MPKRINIMATPAQGGPTYIGNASQVCTEIWGKVPSGYPRNIKLALEAANKSAAFKGYVWKVLPRDIVFLDSALYKS